jgi:hypothetical protein
MASPTAVPGSSPDGSPQQGSSQISVRRTRSVGTKLSDEEYAQLESLAAAQGVTPGECVRELVLAAFGRSAAGKPVPEKAAAEATLGRADGSLRSPRGEDDSHQSHLRSCGRPRGRARADAGADRKGRRREGGKSTRTSESGICGIHKRKVGLWTES